MTDYKDFRAPALWPQVALAALAAIVLWAWPWDKNDAPVRPERLPAVGNQVSDPVILNWRAPYLDCQRRTKDGHWLRWQVAKYPVPNPYREGEFIWTVDCSYGDRGDLQL